MKGNSPDRKKSLAVARTVQEVMIAAEPSLPDADQSAADNDQSAADTDQSASDADQSAAERDDADAVSDEADAVSDQEVADREQASADLNVGQGSKATSQARKDARRARAVTRASRLTTHGSRHDTAQTRLRVAGDRDATGIARDETARRRDLRAEVMEQAVSDSDAPLADQLARLRLGAASDRARARSDRARAAKDRAEAARERAALEEELQGAYIDDLTGALRRKLGMVALTHEFERARRGDGRLVCIFVDVDRLKTVNDRDGHAAGDEVLRALVSIMRAKLRSFDPIVRFGGDEFVCALGRVDIATAEQRFESIDHALREAVSTGISVGLAALAADETLAEVMARADSALLAAKKRLTA